MSFSDEDLKRLKKDINEWAGVHLLKNKPPFVSIPALLARLEAGERLISALKNKETTTEEEIAWRKSKGE